MIEKLMVAGIRATLNENLKDYMDQSDITTYQNYLVKINEWEECRSKGRSIYQQHVGTTKSEYRDRKEYDPKRKLTCFHVES